MRKLISFVLALVIALSCPLLCAVTGHALGTLTSLSTTNIRLNNIFQDQLETMKRNTADLCGVEDTDQIDIEIATVSTIHDFAGNTYTLIECAPQGYMIYHNSSGVFVEYSAVTNSPFWGLDGTFYYCGPNEYYIFDQEATAYRYVFMDEYLSETQISELSDNATLVNQLLVENCNKEVLDYLSGSSNVRPAEIFKKTEETASARTVTAGGWTYVDNFHFFWNLNECGYIDGGRCGYIAAAILLAYDKIYNSLDTVPDSYYYSSNGQYSLNDFGALALYFKGVSLGYGEATTAAEITNTVDSWLLGRGISVNHTCQLFPGSSAATIAQKLNDDRPVIWFGYVSDQDFDSSTGNHAVVVYGYQTNGITYDFVAHFGWNNATAVYFSGILGSLYTYDYE